MRTPMDDIVAVYHAAVRAFRYGAFGSDRRHVVTHVKAS
jgi:hypothetical protein